MDLNLQRNDIERFLFDVRDYFRASLETSEYENTSNLFHMTAAEATEKLLQRCEQLLEQTSIKKINGIQKNSKVECLEIKYPTISSAATTTTATTITINETNANANAIKEQHEDASYLDMTGNLKKKMGSSEFASNEFITSVDSDKTFRCSTRNAENNGNCMTSDEIDSETDDDDDANSGGLFGRDPQIYDICQVSAADDVNDGEELHKAITPDLELTQANDCPFGDLPAGHLAIRKSTKYGQLQRIEKRIFFGQSKKFYCGILNDWLLCYADGPTASRPSITLHLKIPGIGIEHSGEGKRRDVCFQVTTADPNKKFVFQANNEVDAKEWIHAIEAAIRGDSMLKNARKLPTPPVMKRITFMSNMSSKNNGINGSGSGSDITSSNTVDCIYEEPSPLYHIHEPTELLIGRTSASGKRAEEPPELPDKHNDSLAMAKKYEYDVPKCPPQPLITPQVEPSASSQTESETAGLLNTISEMSSLSNTNSIASTQKTVSRSSEKLDFQTKVKDVHSKLSSQLSAGSSPSERLKKASKKSYSCGANDIEAVTLTTPPISPPSFKEQKKQKKSNTPNPSPQKNSYSSTNSSAEKSAKNWFLNRLNKSTSSARSSTISTPAKCKQSEKENLLNSLEMYDNFEGSGSPEAATTPIMKSSGGGGSVGSSCKSKVNMIINQFEASGAHLTMFSVEALASNAVASFSSFCENDCNNYEPIMTVSTPPSSFMKKV